MRFTYRAAGPVAAAAVLTLLAGCSRTQQDWSAAQQAGTPRAYLVFVQRHPDSELADVARQRIAQLTEEAAWQQATRANTAAAYQSYLAKYPNGSWSQDARIRMESRSLAASTSTSAPRSSSPVAPDPTAPVTAAGRPGLAPAPSAAPTAALTAPASAAHSNTAVARAARPAVVARAARSGVSHSAVQLGAFGSAANARAAWKQLSTKFRPQLAGLTARVVPVTLSGRRLYRLEAGVASQAAARRLCRQLQQHSQGCLPVP